jgi:Na+-translocating ferredoxin:NAD+ oxidoreductase subunit B
MTDNPYKRLARRLDELPNGYPPTDSGVELQLLAYLFSPEEAELAAGLRLTKETPEEIAARLGGPPEWEAKALRQRLKEMANRGLIAAGRAAGGLGFGLMPFVIGIYEMQAGTIDAELARLFEGYYQEAYGQMLAVEPQIHRVIPVNEAVRVDLAIEPYDSAELILEQGLAWAVQDCICRKQKALIGDPCGHPLDVCLVIGPAAGIFDHSPGFRPLDLEEAKDTLRRSAAAGLVHAVSNNQDGHFYICNCCTCSCGILRGMADLGLSNVVASSAYVSQLDAELCHGCDICLESCQFGALSLDEGLMVAAVDRMRCVGCGLCVTACPEGALSLVRRPAGEVKRPPEQHSDWLAARARARNMDIRAVL